MILFHGQADPVFSVNDTIRWYEQLNANWATRIMPGVRRDDSWRGRASHDLDGVRPH
jgi:hypothetical protein